MLWCWRATGCALSHPSLSPTSRVTSAKTCPEATTLEAPRELQLLHPPQSPSIPSSSHEEPQTPVCRGARRRAGLRAAASDGAGTRRFPRSGSGGWIVPGHVSLLLDESPPASLLQASRSHWTGRAMLLPTGLTLSGWDQRTGRFLPSLGDIGSFAQRG